MPIKETDLHLLQVNSTKEEQDKLSHDIDLLQKARAMFKTTHGEKLTPEEMDELHTRSHAEWYAKAGAACSEAKATVSDYEVAHAYPTECPDFIKPSFASAVADELTGLLGINRAELSRVWEGRSLREGRPAFLSKGVVTDIPVNDVSAELLVPQSAMRCFGESERRYRMNPLQSIYNWFSYTVEVERFIQGDTIFDNRYLTRYYRSEAKRYSRLLGHKLNKVELAEVFYRCYKRPLDISVYAALRAA